jgi:hypothetical protein
MKKVKSRKLNTIVLMVLLIVTSSTNYLFGQKLNSNFKKTQVRTMEGLKLAYVDERTGNRITQAKYDEGQDFYDGVTSVAIAGKAGAIDTLGNEIIPLIYAKVWLLGDRMFAVSKTGNKFALANAIGQVLTQEIYDQFGNDTGAFSNGICAVSKLNKWGYIDKAGKLLGLIDYDQVTAFHNGIGKVGKKSGYENMQFEAILNAGFVNDKGVLVTEIKYNYGKSKISNKIVLALDSKSSNQYGYSSAGTAYALAEKNGKIIIPFDSNYIFDVTYDDCIMVHLSGTSKFGLLDWDGKVLVPINFSKIEFVQDGDKFYTKVYFDNSNYFYLNEKYECFEYKGVSCPEK